MKNLTKLLKFAVLASFMLLGSVVDAQFSRQQAINLVLNQIVGSDTISVDVYVSYDSLLSTDKVILLDGDTLDCYYPANWVFYIDDAPFSGWTHDIRIVYVDTSNGDYHIVSNDFFPENLDDDFEEINSANQPQPAVLQDYTGDPPVYFGPNDYYAVIICDLDEQQYWNDISVLYSTLIQQYGYKKEKIFVHYDFDGISPEWGEDLDGDGQDDIDYPAINDRIHLTMKDLAGITDDDPFVPELQTTDQLMIFLTGVVTQKIERPSTVWFFWEDTGQGGYLKVDDPGTFFTELAEINCAQINMLLSINYAGGIEEYFTDYTNYTVQCKNRNISSSNDFE